MRSPTRAADGAHAFFAFFFVALACAAAAGCTKISESNAPASNAWTVPGVVRLSINTDVNSFDPVIARLYAENYVEEAIFSGLVKYDSTGKLIGDLAIDVPSLRNGGISKDGRTIVYHLRHGALWQDGVPVTSADVRFTWDLIMNPASNSPVRSTYARIASVATPNAYTVMLHLHQPYSPLLSNVFCNGGFGEIVPEHVLSKSRDLERDPFNVHPIGSGPYRLERWDRGSTIVLRAFDRYFGGAPHIREIDVQILTNDNTQLVTMESHQLDAVTQARPEQLGPYRQIAGVRVSFAPSQEESYLSFNLTHPPLDDIKVRRALAMTLDRKTIAARSFAGTAVLAQTMIPPYGWAYDGDDGAPVYDPAAAGKLLDAAGWIAGPDGMRSKDGHPLTIGFVHYDSPGAAREAEQIERAWHAAGVDVRLRAAPRNVVVGQLETSGNFDVILGGAGFDADPDRSQFEETAFIDPRGFNDARYSDADVDRWSEQALQTYDRGERKRLYGLISRRLNRDLPYVPIAWLQFVYVTNADLRGFEPETVNSDFWNVQDWTN